MVFGVGPDVGSTSTRDAIIQWTYPAGRGTAWREGRPPSTVANLSLTSELFSMIPTTVGDPAYYCNIKFGFCSRTLGSNLEEFDLPYSVYGNILI